MATREIFLSGIPRLDRRSAYLRDRTRLKTNKYGQNHTLFIFPEMAQTHSSVKAPEHATIADLSTISRLARRETSANRPNERVASIAKEHQHTQPAEIATSAIPIETEGGKKWFPFEATKNIPFKLDEKTYDFRTDVEKLKKIKELYVIQHGVMRNAKDYQKFFEKTFRKLGKKFDPETMLIVSPQFLAPVDLKGKGKLWGAVNPDNVLRWRYNDWRGAEPAQNPDAPVDSFTAMDSFLNYFMRYAPGLKKIEFRGNSEGAQFLDRYLMYSKTLKAIEETYPVTINGVISNAGTAHYPTPIRPVFNDEAVVDWVEYAKDADEHLWPLGLYDPPPYILESLEDDKIRFPNEDPLDRAFANYLRRTMLSIGTADNNPMGSQLPVGPGPGYRAQGTTRLLRFLGKVAYLIKIQKEKEDIGITLPGIRTLQAHGFGHSAEDIFHAIEITQNEEVPT